jgi:myo-inositol-1(or 4)-monophosphatase
MLDKEQQLQYLSRIESALGAATDVALRHKAGTFEVLDRGGRDVVTEVDRRISDVLRAQLLRPGEGWLSEEDADDQTRLSCEIVWVVDPLDGTSEFVDGLPEWCISVGLVENGVAVAGGTSNPATGETFLGAIDCGVHYNGRAVQASAREQLQGARVLASRSEFKRGEWQRFEDSSLSVQPMGSVAYKLSLVAAGLADATWTLSPKNEWDVAAGVALVTAAGGNVRTIYGLPVTMNKQNPLMAGLIASGKPLWQQVVEMLGADTEEVDM